MSNLLIQIMHRTIITKPTVFLLMALQWHLLSWFPPQPGVSGHDELENTTKPVISAITGLLGGQWA